MPSTTETNNDDEYLKSEILKYFPSSGDIVDQAAFIEGRDELFRQIRDYDIHPDHIDKYLKAIQEGSARLSKYVPRISTERATLIIAKMAVPHILSRAEAYNWDFKAVNWEEVVMSIKQMGRSLPDLEQFARIDDFNFLMRIFKPRNFELSYKRQIEIYDLESYKFKALMNIYALIVSRRRDSGMEIKRDTWRILVGTHVMDLDKVHFDRVMAVFKDFANRAAFSNQDQFTEREAILEQISDIVRDIPEEL